jgi:hypothetical protein
MMPQPITLPFGLISMFALSETYLNQQRNEGWNKNVLEIKE